jgi:hypothetical protein
VQLITDFKPDIIMVTPSYMLAIAEEFERQGWTRARQLACAGIFGAEPWTNDMRATSSSAGIDAVDIYGLSEVMGPGVASECVETKDGPTIWEDHFYPEIIDPETGEVLPDGEMGELVFTSLTKEALPVIRYRTRDLTRLLPGTARTMRRHVHAGDGHHGQGRGPRQGGALGRRGAAAGTLRRAHRRRRVHRGQGLDARALPQDAGAADQPARAFRDRRHAARGQLDHAARPRSSARPSCWPRCRTRAATASTSIPRPRRWAPRATR